ncbi:MAG: NAD(P)H-hydrate dehydratase [Bacteroidota bacterium]
MEVLSAADLKTVDRETMTAQQISSSELMERASMALVISLWDEGHIRQGHTQHIVFICGSGNNGGDGLAMARILHSQGFQITVWHAQIGDLSPDNQLMRDRLPSGIEYNSLEKGDELSNIDFTSADLIIDALFGVGLSRPITGYWAKVVEHCNEQVQNCPIIAVDLPSGLPAEREAGGVIMRAKHTLCIGLPKLNLFFAENGPYVGEWSVIDIGLEQTAIQEKSALAHYGQIQDFRLLLRSRTRFGHKGTYGHVGVVAGSYGKIGAAILSVRAALRSGAGLVTAHVPACGYALLQTSIPEAMCQADEHSYAISRISPIDKYSALAIGPGIGQNLLTINALDDLFNKLDKPVVIDADGLNILAQHPDWLHRLPKNSILTPHPGEFDRLFGAHHLHFRRWKTALENASKLGLIIILKGAYTSIASPDGRAYFNGTGNPGMGTAGSGDVLTGIIAGLLAQGYDSIDAARLGVFLHGLAGDLAAQHEEQEAVIAGDIISYLGRAFQKTRNAL